MWGHQRWQKPLPASQDQPVIQWNTVTSRLIYCFWGYAKRWLSSFFTFKSSFWIGCLFSPECWIWGSWHLCLVVNHLSVAVPWAELAIRTSSWQYQLLVYTTWAAQGGCFPSASRWWMQLPGQQPSHQLFQGQKGWWQMSRYLMASIITKTFCLYLRWIIVKEVHKAVTLLRGHADQFHHIQEGCWRG